MMGRNIFERLERLEAACLPPAPTPAMIFRFDGETFEAAAKRQHVRPEDVDLVIRVVDTSKDDDPDDGDEVPAPDDQGAVDELDELAAEVERLEGRRRELAARARKD